jgi:predicted DNA-binding transcriptional regulator AlpA
MLRRRAVQAAVPMGTSALYLKIQEGIFPRPIDLGNGGGGAVAWFESDIATYVDLLTANRDGKLSEWLAARRAERGDAIEAWVVKLAERLSRPKPRRGRPPIGRKVAA